MTHVDLWTFRAAEPTPDISGFDVETSDGEKIGTVDEASYDLGTSALVVDTGWWIFGKRRMIPAGAVEQVDLTTRRIALRLTKAQVKDAPDYDEARAGTDDHRREMDEYYSRW